MKQPLVSIICPVYNGERFLAEAIASVLQQDFADFQLLIVDDGSTDASLAIARDRANSDPERIRCLQHAGGANRGAAASRNLGLNASHSTFVAFIDADDAWRPHKLRRQLEIIEAHPEAGMVCGAANYWRSWEGGRDQVLASGEPVGGISRPPRTALQLYPLGSAIAPCPSDLLIRRDVVTAIGGFEPSFTGPRQLYEDQAFLLKVYLSTPVFFASDVLLDYRIHAESCVSRVTRDGLEPEMRRYFLDWLEEYVRECDVPGRQQLVTAIARARWKLDNPVRGSMLRKAAGAQRRLLTSLAGLGLRMR